MIYKWESAEGRVQKFIKVPIAKKMLWLHEMNEWFRKYSSKKTLEIRRKIKEMRSLGR